MAPADRRVFRTCDRKSDDAGLFYCGELSAGKTVGFIHAGGIMNEEKNVKLKNIKIDFVEGLLVFIIIANMILIMVWVQSLQGTARVINYTGIVRGATQRLVKLELMGKPNPDLEARLDGILTDLCAKDTGTNNLILLPDDNYQKCLTDLSLAWTELRAEIDNLRDGAAVSDKVLELSEEYFELADKTVSAAEVYSQALASRIQKIEIVTGIIMLLEVLLIIFKSVSNVKMIRRMRELDRLAFIDQHTGLPNKSRCMQYLNNTDIVPEHTMVFMFDLNFLKQVNDELGHEAGDSLIKNFAVILRNNVPPQHFVGRFGGDEFLVIANGVTKEDMKNMEEKLLEAEERFNQTAHRGYTLSFSYGYSSSDDFMDCTYQILFEKADHNMYEYKKALKETLGKKSLR